ncbi:adenylyltransferase/cytidyltransferase family protein [Paeniglutamicibacter antarcticus]|uniref:Adenylyltransferase/cytidyltransferase family protein n=1 Tax=Paeniglutamicibacter antarcticus TaxID=494023 RepID=A0ABP9TS13_9MICC
MIIGYAAGAFDLFHVGHLNVLRQAKLRCDYLVAGVVCDDLVEANKGFRPVIPTNERAEIVANISFVDDVYVETKLDRLETWADVKFDVFFKGDDWKGSRKGLELERRFAGVGVRVEYFPYTVHTSSSKLRRALDALLTTASTA